MQREVGEDSPLLLSSLVAPSRAVDEARRREKEALRTIFETRPPAGAVGGFVAGAAAFAGGTALARLRRSKDALRASFVSVPVMELNSNGEAFRRSFRAFRIHIW